MPEPGYTTEEMMTIAAARALPNGAVCFVGIGLPSAAANLARLTHAPDVVLIYESGTIGAKPHLLPLSIGDDELAETASAIVSAPEVFRYWLQGGRVDVGFLGAAQIDRFGNINTTVIGDYKEPKVRLPGAGGAPEIASLSGEVFVTLRHSTRALVEKLDFVTTAGFVSRGGGNRPEGAQGRGVTRVITDLGVLEPDSDGKELVLTTLHPGATAAEAQEATGWDLKLAAGLETTPAPTPDELAALRELHARTARAHSERR